MDPRPPILATALLLGSLPAAAAPAAADVPEIVAGATGRTMHALLTRAETLGFSGQVLVESEGRLVLNRAYGLADRRSGRRFTVDTPTGLASISKHLVALGVLRLVDQGRLDLQAPIGDLLPGVPPDKAAITPHQLLTHTSGLRGGDVAGDFVMTSRADLLERVLSRPLHGAPGEQWRYSNGGFSLLATLIEEISGRPYETFLSAEILQPAGMHRTRAWHQESAGPPLAAHAYMGWRDQGAPEDWPRNWRTFGAGGLLSTAADLYRLERALREGRVLKKRTWQAAQREQASIRDGLGFGHGLFVYEDDGRRVVEHGGDWERGFNGLFMRYVDEGHLVIVTCNSRDHQGHWLRQSVQRKLEEILRTGRPGTDLPDARPLDAATRQALTETFWFPDGSQLIGFDDGVTAWVGASGQGALDAMVGPPVEDTSAARRANARTRTLLSALVRGERGYIEALGEAGAPHLGDYEGEWSDLTGAEGVLIGFELLGSVVAGEIAVTAAALEFDGGNRRFMRYNWSDRAEGRLVGTFVRPAWYPAGVLVALPVVQTPDGPAAYDLYGESAVPLRLTPEAGGRPATVRVGDAAAVARRRHPFVAADSRSAL